MNRTDEMTRVAQLVEQSRDEWSPEWQSEVVRWSTPEIRSAFDLSEDAASVLWMVLAGMVDPRRNTYDLPQSMADRFLWTVKEALHQGLDGWSEEEQTIILAFLSDVTYSTNDTGN